MGRPSRKASLYRFGEFALNSRTGELACGARKIPLRDQSLRLLLALLEHPGELVAREELVERLWPAGTFVDADRGLNKAINHLREALTDSAEQPQFIETLPRKGYRFIATVMQDGQEEDASEPEAPEKELKARLWLWAAAVAVTCVGIIIAGSVGGVRNLIPSHGTSPPQISALAVIPLENLSHNPEEEYFADGMTDALITTLAKMGQRESFVARLS